MRLEIPDIFDLKHSEKYVLTIRLRADGFAFALYDPWLDGSYFYREIPYSRKMSELDNLKEIFFENDFLSLPYKKLQVLHYSPYFTFVPSILYEEKAKEVFFDFHFSHRRGRCLGQPLQRPELNIVFDVNEEQYEFLHRSLLQPQFVHHISPLISFFQYRSKLGNTNKLIINLQKDSVDVLCFSLGELVLANNFPGKDVNDMIYYIFFIWKQLKLNQLKDTILIVGDPVQKIEIMKILKKYLKNIIPFNFVPEHHLMGVDTKEIPFDIISLSLCEL